MPWWQFLFSHHDLPSWQFLILFSANCQIGSFDLLRLCSLHAQLINVELALFLCKVSIQWGPAVQGTCEAHESSLLAEYIVQLYAPRIVHYPARRAVPISCNRLSIHESCCRRGRDLHRRHIGVFLITAHLGLVNIVC